MSSRMRITSGAKGNRQSHHGLEGTRLSKCGNCGEAHRRHNACANCGQYKGRMVIDVAAKLRKRAEKLKKRGMGDQAQEEAKNAPAGVELAKK